jgi:VWFA-related protein
VLLFALAATAAALLRGQAQEQPRQVIRTGTDVVLVDVSVRDGGRAVAELRAEDFVLTDNGVRQRIESVEATAVPIDLTLVVDLSSSQRGMWTPGTPLAQAIASLQEEIAGVTRLLRPEDRVRLLAIGTTVQQLWPMVPVASIPRLTSLDREGLSSLFDTLAVALLQQVEPARRHVVIARTKGIDTISSVDAQTIRGIAGRSDALLHVVGMETALQAEIGLFGFQCGNMGFCWPTRRFWTPFRRRLFGIPLPPDGVTIGDAAQSTGGGLHRSTGLILPTLTNTFTKAFEDFRSGYLLRYTPQDVPRGGWHAIEVTVPRGRSYAVRSRNGYFVEEPAAVAPPLPVPTVPRTLRELTMAYERGAYSNVVAGLRQVEDPARLLREFEEAGNPWPATPRREAAFALELAESALFSSRTRDRAVTHELMIRFSRLIRHPIEPEMFERYWFFAALTLLEGALRPASAETFVNLALERFPGEPRFVLSRAIVTDQRWATARGADAGGIPGPADPNSVERRYAEAMAFPETAAEARVRLAWFLHRTGKPGEALPLLTDSQATPRTDPALRYLTQLFLGHTFIALNRHHDAVKAFREAMTIVPSAQSARVTLMNALLARGDRAGAEELAERIQTETSDDVDPWWMYWQGQYRFHPVAMARLRESIK